MHCAAVLSEEASYTLSLEKEVSVLILISIGFGVFKNMRNKEGTYQEIQ